MLIPDALHASPKPPPTGTASAARIIDHEPGRSSPACGRPYAVRGNLMGAASNTMTPATLQAGLLCIWERVSLRGPS